MPNSPIEKLAKNRLFVLFSILLVSFIIALLLALLSFSPKTVQKQKEGTGTPSVGREEAARLPAEEGWEAATGERPGEITREEGIPPVTYPQVTTRRSPDVRFETYTLEANRADVPDQVRVFQLASGVSSADALSLGRRIGFSNANLDDGANLSFVYNGEQNSDEVLIFDKKTGAFFFASNNGRLPKIAASDPINSAKNFLADIGVLDGTIVATTTYKRDSFPGLIFVEFHRRWASVGLPILNILGTLNTDPGKRLADVNLAKVDEDGPVDPDIVFSTDGQAGKARPNEFNTITVAVSENDRSVVSITSNMRRIVGRQVISTSSLKTPGEAWDELQQHRGVFSTTLPTGLGYVDPDKVYLQNQAIGQHGRVKDFLLVYLEKPADQAQSYLYPYYIFKGEATLNSGYDVSFVEAIPALKGVDYSSQVLGEMAVVPTIVNQQQESTIQYGTFKFPTMTPSPTPTPQPPPPTEAPKTECPPFTNEYILPDGGKIAWHPSAQPPARKWYYIPAENEVVDEQRLTQVLNQRIDAINSCAPQSATVCPATQATKETTRCYYLTTGSPSIYLYKEDAGQVQVTVKSPYDITYVDPGFTSEQEKLWNVFATKDGNMIVRRGDQAGNEERRLYFEYEKKGFLSAIRKYHHPAVGFTIKWEDLDQFITYLSQNLGLNEKETEDLLAEARRETRNLTSPYLKVSLLERSLLDKYLKVDITPAPIYYYRIHLFIQAASLDEKLEVPALERIERGGFTVIEAGVVTE